VIWENPHHRDYGKNVAAAAAATGAETR